MLNLNINSEAELIILTLNELKTLSLPYYLMIFTHVETKQQVTKIFAPSEDLSSYKDRYNKYAIATSTLFANKPIGEWHYAVYEQTSDSNTDPKLSTGLVEKGKMRLHPSSEYSQTAIYDNQTTFKAYQS